MKALTSLFAAILCFLCGAKSYYANHIDIDGTLYAKEITDGNRYFYVDMNDGIYKLDVSNDVYESVAPYGEVSMKNVSLQHIVGAEYDSTEMLLAKFIIIMGICFLVHGISLIIIRL